jgi:adenine-specific DNA-methyltransferase
MKISKIQAVCVSKTQRGWQRAIWGAPHSNRYYRTRNKAILAAGALAEQKAAPIIIRGIDGKFQETNRQFCSKQNLTDYLVEQGSNLDFLDKIENKSVQLIITSPPYNVGKEYEKISSLDAYVKIQEEIITKCATKLKDTGSICWQVGNSISKKDAEVIPLDIILYPIFKKLGFTLKNRIIWHFEHGLHCKNRFSGRHETILWFVKDTNNYIFNLDPVRVPSKYPGKRYYKGLRKGELSGNPLGKNPGDVWDIPNVKHNHCEKTEHPCQFPVELVERFVLSLTNENDIVFDPYLGAGSTVIAALKNKRKGYGCDIEKKYIDISLERIELLEKGELKTRAMNTPIYDPKKVKKEDESK